MSKPIKRPYVHFLGNASHDVTGSSYVIRFNTHNILLECGLIQDNRDIYSLYQANRDQINSIKANTITCSIAPHGNHSDHMGLYPALFHKGYKGSVFVPEGNKKILEIMWADNLKIMTSDCQKIERKWGKPAPVLFNEDDIQVALDHLVEIPYN